MPPHVLSTLLYAALLHLCCGIARDDASRALQGVSDIVVVFLTSCGVAAEMISQHLKPIPLDIRTVMTRLELDPQYVNHPCCPKCHAVIQGAETSCKSLENSAGSQCGAELYKARSNLRIGSRSVPIARLPVLDVSRWIEQLLQRPGIEDQLDQCLKSSRQTSRSIGSTVTDVQQARVWRNFKDCGQQFTGVSGNLAFSFYLDWFKPFDKTLSGSSASLGALILICLSLPPEERYRLENVCVVSILPGPKEVSIDSINNVLSPVVTQMRNLWDGQMMSTFRGPRTIRAAILGILGDTPAIRKLGGYAWHTSLRPCPFCVVTLDNLHDVNDQPATFGPVQREAAEVYRTETSAKRRAAHVRQTGMRYSVLNDLPYRNPVEHTTIGLMHVAFIGWYKHLFTQVWNIGERASELLTCRPEDGNAQSSDSEDDGAVMQLYDDLLEDDQEDMDWQGEHATDSAASAGEHMSDEDTDDGLADPTRCVFSNEELRKMAKVFARLQLPSHVQALPVRLLTSAAGSLKADSWRVLFTIYLVAAVPEIWASASSRQHDQLDNLFHLISAVNLASAQSVDDRSATRFDNHFISYRRGLDDLYHFGAEKPGRINLHLGSHVGGWMRLWGPLWWTSEWAGERFIGIIGRINNNRRFGSSEHKVRILTEVRHA